LKGRRFCDAYTALADRWLTGLLGAESGVALVAVGGYGRRELCPGSDLDVLLLHGGRRDVAAVADRIWYPVWDAGVPLDHSVRTVKEAMAAADRDLKVALGLLRRGGLPVTAHSRPISTAAPTPCGTRVGGGGRASSTNWCGCATNASAMSRSCSSPS
jgi:hypothetical protein